MQRSVFFLAIACCCAAISEGMYLMMQNKTSVEETQHAVCKIVTKELQATANVTLTRELKGVCTSSEINKKFEELQDVLLKELQLIRQQLKEEAAISEEDYQYQNSPEIKITKRTVHNNNQFAADLETNRRAEILKYNATINSSAKGTFFYYYWQIENINELLSDTRGISVRSPSFTLLGRSFHIILFPHHMTSKYLGVQLKGPRSAFLKHRFTIVDHVSGRGDLSSQLLGDERNYAVMYRVAHDRVEQRNFIDGDMLVIKVSIVVE